VKIVAGQSAPPFASLLYPKHGISDFVLHFQQQLIEVCLPSYPAYTLNQAKMLFRK